MRTHVARREFLGWSAAAGWALLAGCEPTPTEDDGSPGRSVSIAGKTVPIRVPEGFGFETTWRPFLDEWQARTGAKAEFAAGNGPGLVVFPAPALADLADRGILAPIPDTERQHVGWPNILAGFRDRILAPGGRPLALPLSLPVLACYYRADLLARAGLEPPRTWEDYDRLVATCPEWAPGLAAIEPRAPQWTVTLLLARSAAYVRHPESLSTLFDISSGEPLIHEPAYVRALGEWLRLGPQLDPAASHSNPARCRQLLLEGRVALAIAAEPGRGPVPFPFGPSATEKPADADSERTAKDVDRSRPEGAKIGCVPLPGAKESYNRSTRRWDAAPAGPIPHPPLAGFAGLCAGISADTPADVAPAAWNLLGLLLSADAPAPFPPGTRTACFATDSAAALGWLAPGLHDDETGSVLAAILESGNDPLLVPDLAVVGRDEFRAALEKSIAAAVEGKSTAEQALRAASDDWSVIARRLGSDRVRDAARRSAGLAPLAPAPSATPAK